MNINRNKFEELYELENFEGSGFSTFLKDQSKKFIKKAASSAIEKAVNTRSTAAGEKIGSLIANKIIPSKKINNSENLINNKNLVNENSSTTIPIDSGYKIVKLLQKIILNL